MYIFNFKSKIIIKKYIDRIKKIIIVYVELYEEKDISLKLSIEKKEIKKDITVYHLVGEVDFLEAPKLKKKIFEDLSDNLKLNFILDLQEVSYLDSSGLGVLATIAQSLGNPKQMRICNLNKSIKSLMTLTQIAQLFNIDGNLEESIRIFSS